MNGVGAEIGIGFVGTTTTGIAAALLAAFVFALWNIYLQRGLARGAPLHLALLALAISEVICFVPATIVLALAGALPPLRGQGILWFLLAGVMTTVIGSLLAVQATSRIGAARTTAIRLLDPFFALVIAAFFLHETLSFRTLGGIALLVFALFLLERDRRGAATAVHGSDAAIGPLYAIATSLAFTVGSVIRKAGLALIPSAIVAAAMEGVAGVVIIGLMVSIKKSWRDPRPLRAPLYRDLWWSGLAAAAGTFFLNLALQRVSVPVAVALRNTSPWFALALVPLLLGMHHRPTRVMWLSTGLLTIGMLLIVLR